MGARGEGVPGRGRDGELRAHAVRAHHGDTHPCSAADPGPARPLRPPTVVGQGGHAGLHGVGDGPRAIRAGAVPGELGGARGGHEAARQRHGDSEAHPQRYHPRHLPELHRHLHWCVHHAGPARDASQARRGAQGRRGTVLHAASRGALLRDVLGPHIRHVRESRWAARAGAAVRERTGAAPQRDRHRRLCTHAGRAVHRGPHADLPD
mmetsp:Transcript_91134/g.244381  ORF Transcript_91134/g.244381 Transcript_91134/m.244381 type:complete len:208 (+) Transcript_91134:272-895(+)